MKGIKNRYKTMKIMHLRFGRNKWILTKITLLPYDWSGNGGKLKISKGKLNIGVTLGGGSSALAPVLCSEYRGEWNGGR